MSHFYPKISSAHRLVRQAQKQGFDALLITQKRGGFRKKSSLGSTYSPKRAVMINNKSWSIAGAKQFLSGSKNQ